MESECKNNYYYMKYFQYFNFFFKVGDGLNGWPEHGPYNAIYVGAAAECISIFYFISPNSL